MEAATALGGQGSSPPEDTREQTHFRSSGQTVSWSLPVHPASEQPAWPPSLPSHRGRRGHQKGHGLPSPARSGCSHRCNQGLQARPRLGTWKGRRISLARTRPKAGEGEKQKPCVRTQHAHGHSALTYSGPSVRLKLLSSSGAWCMVCEATWTAPPSPQLQQLCLLTGNTAPPAPSRARRLCSFPPCAKLGGPAQRKQ